MPGETTPLSPGPHGELALALDAVVLDVGLAGIAIETETRLNPDRSLVVRLGESESSIVLPGRVVWCFFHGTAAAESGEQRPVYRAGIEFADLLTPSAQRLVAFLEAQVAPSGESRLFGRFPVSRSQRIQIEATGSFRCLEIGSDEVLVEVELGIDPVAGQVAALSPRGGGPALVASVASARRGESPDRWEVALATGAADPRAHAALRGVVYN